MQEKIYKVYIKIDDDNNIIAINSDAFIESEDIKNWIYIDEGTGDKYYHAQGNYFENSIYTNEGISKYSLVNGKLQKTSNKIIKTKKCKQLKHQPSIIELNNKINQLEKQLLNFETLLTDLNNSSNTIKS